MTGGIKKTCKRCQNEILCKVEDITNCACSTLVLTKQTRDFLKETFFDCLCNSCLKEIESLVEKAHATTTKSTENIHYYIDKGLLVFTELNHVQRGYCCKSKCRHCAYGYS